MLARLIFHGPFEPRPSEDAAVILRTVEAAVPKRHPIDQTDGLWKVQRDPTGRHWLHVNRFNVKKIISKRPSQRLRSSILNP